MSIYAYLTCTEARELIFLGKAVWTTTADGEKRVSYFHRGPEEAPPSSRNELLSRAVWKFLAVNTGKELKVLLEDELPDGEYVCIGGDSREDISFEDYLRDWPG
jgi:hypothetical protein